MSTGIPLGLAVWVLRLALAAAFLSAVADRLGWWGPPGASGVAWGDWASFERYVARLLDFVPRGLLTAVAVAATAAEVVLAILLVAGVHPRWTAFASAALLGSFALAMTVELGVKAPLDASVFTAAAAALVLGTISGKGLRG